MELGFELRDLPRTGSLCTRAAYHWEFVHRTQTRASRACYERHLPDPEFSRELGFKLWDFPETGSLCTRTVCHWEFVHRAQTRASRACY